MSRHCMTSLMPRHKTPHCKSDTPSPYQSSTNNIFAFQDIDGPVVYHKNPVGTNHIFKRKRGKIVGFINSSRKRAIVTWDVLNIQTQHNASSLLKSPPQKKTRKKEKKRRRVIIATVKKNLNFNNGSSVSSSHNPQTWSDMSASSPVSSASSPVSTALSMNTACEHFSWLDSFLSSFSPNKKSHSP